MGCAGSSQKKGEDHTKKVKKPKPWKHPQSITMSELRRMREEFWDTAPHYGGQKAVSKMLYMASMNDGYIDNLHNSWMYVNSWVLHVFCPYMRMDILMHMFIYAYVEIWDALRAAAESNDVNLAQAIVDSAGIILANADMTTCYDERGAKYELQKYVLSEPINLVRDS